MMYLTGGETTNWSRGGVQGQGQKPGSDNWLHLNSAVQNSPQKLQGQASHTLLVISTLPTINLLYKSKHFVDFLSAYYTRMYQILYDTSALIVLSPNDREVRFLIMEPSSLCTFWSSFHRNVMVYFSLNDAAWAVGQMVQSRKVGQMHRQTDGTNGINSPLRHTTWSIKRVSLKMLCSYRTTFKVQATLPHPPPVKLICETFDQNCISGIQAF